MAWQLVTIILWISLSLLITNVSGFVLPPTSNSISQSSFNTELNFLVRIVSQGDVAIVERLGKYQRLLGPGLYFGIPIVDSIRAKVSTLEQVFDIPPQKCITADNAPLSADAVVYWKIVNAQKATYSVQDLKSAIQNLVLTQLRAEIGKLTLDKTFSAREEINDTLLRDLDVATEPWGIQVLRVEVRDIIPNPEIMAAMELQMASERTKRAVIAKSEGERARVINEAEGEAQSRLKPKEPPTPWAF